LQSLFASQGRAPVAGGMQVWPIVVDLSIVAQSRGFLANELLPSTFTPASIFYFFNSLLHLATISAVAVTKTASSMPSPPLSLSLSLSLSLCVSLSRIRLYTARFVTSRRQPPLAAIAAASSLSHAAQDRDGIRVPGCEGFRASLWRAKKMSREGVGVLSQAKMSPPFMFYYFFYLYFISAISINTLFKTKIPQNKW